MTGPIYVDGAEPGRHAGSADPRRSTSCTTSASTRSRPAAACCRPTSRTRGSSCCGGRTGATTVAFGARASPLPLAPFFGSIGVAPPPLAGRISSRPPGWHGGNLDNKDLVAGSTLYLPVHVAGALLSIGDGHAVQGHGEVTGTALETSLRGHLRGARAQGRAPALAAGRNAHALHRHGAARGPR